MLNRISCLIISPNEFDYSNLGYDDGMRETEKKFDILTAKTAEEGLEILSKKHGIDCIVTIGKVDEWKLNHYGVKLFKPFIHLNEFNSQIINEFILSSFFKGLSQRKNRMFSFITPMYKTKPKWIERLHNSLLNQDYKYWEWLILDDSPDDETIKYVESLNDFRITVIKNVTNHGVIGFNKNILSNIANGDWIVEIDHDDEIVPNALTVINNCIDTYPDSDFIYSDAMELNGDEPILYGDNFSLGQGIYKKEIIMGRERIISITTPSINCKSIRAIYAEPNHVRIWKKDFYHRIGGHNQNLSVLDDMDLMIRTFLNGKMTHINKTLYIQHEDGDVNGRGDTAQGHRFAEIQRTNWLLYGHYDKAIHDRILELGYEDTIWNEVEGHSEWWRDDVDLPIMSNEFYPDENI